MRPLPYATNTMHAQDYSLCLADTMTVCRPNISILKVVFFLYVYDTTTWCNSLVNKALHSLTELR